jgi:hypothetical protein
MVWRLSARGSSKPKSRRRCASRSGSCSTRSRPSGRTNPAWLYLMHLRDGHFSHTPPPTLPDWPFPRAIAAVLHRRCLFPHEGSRAFGPLSFRQGKGPRTHPMRRSGLWVLSKRLEKGTFAWPKPGDGVGGKLPLESRSPFDADGWNRFARGQDASVV